MDTEWDAFLANWTATPSKCPRCQGELKNEHTTFLVVDPEDEYSIMSGDGLFCQECTVLLLDADEFDDKAELVGFTDRYAVAGLVNWEAIPENKRDVPVGEPGNPIPLIKFNSFRPGLPERY